MSNSKTSRGSEVRSLLLNKLPDILTCKEETVLPLLGDQEVCVRLADVFERMTQDGSSRPTDSLKPGSREWLGHTMASLPLRNVYAYQCGALSIRPTSDSSLRYLLMGYMPDHRAVTDKGVLNRELLCMSLYEQLSDQGKEHYGPIAEWRANLGLSEDYSLQGDVAIAKYIHWVEVLFSRRYAALETDVRAHLELPPNRPTPANYIEPLAKSARTIALERLNGYIASVSSGAGTPDDIVVLVLSHVAANRVLLESACRDDLTKRATKASLFLLRAMNAAGVNEVPPLATDAEVRSCLQTWFGRDGRVRKHAEWDVLSEDSIDVALKHASDAQAMYRRTRGAIQVQLQPEAFDTPGDKLIFALGLVACYYGDVKVRNELVGEHRSEYLVFPKRDQQLRDNPLSPNALEMAMTLFGQIAMSNSEWNLSADALDNYSHATSLRRGHLQRLIFDVFKGWTAPQLLAVQAAFEREVFELELELA